MTMMTPYGVTGWEFFTIWGLPIVLQFTWVLWQLWEDNDDTEHLSTPVGFNDPVPNGVWNLVPELLFWQRRDEELVLWRHK